MAVNKICENSTDMSRSYYFLSIAFESLIGKLNSTAVDSIAEPGSKFEQVYRADAMSLIFV